MALHIDHIVWGVDDLDRAAAQVQERYGLASVPGGRHPGWGTANRIIPLGPSYLELATPGTSRQPPD
jgi:Glyoxalase-like domain